MIIYAINKDGQEVHISQVKKGLACNCFCKQCKKPLIAKKGEIKKHFFAHKKGDKDCGYHDKEETETKRKYNINPKTTEDYIEKHIYTCGQRERKDSLNYLWERFKKPFIAQDYFNYILVLRKETHYGKEKLYGKCVKKEWVEEYKKRIFNSKDSMELTNIDKRWYSFIEIY